MPRAKIPGNRRYSSVPRTFQSAADIRRDRDLSGGPGRSVGDAPREANLFAVELVKSAKVQGLPFKEVLKRVRTSVAEATRDRQMVWESSPAPGEFVISSVRKPVRAADLVEQGFWETIKGSDSAADFKAYLIPYPDGPFAVAARARLQQIEASNQPKPASPAPPPAASPPAAPQSAIRDCPQCPEIVLIEPGAFEMGSSEMFDFEAPVHQVSIRKPFYIGRREVTFEEWDACLAEGGCKQKPDDRGLGAAGGPSRIWIGTTPRATSRGCRRRPGRPTGCPRKANGNTSPEPARRRPIPGDGPSKRTRPTVSAAPAIP